MSDATERADDLAQGRQDHEAIEGLVADLQQAARVRYGARGLIAALAVVAAALLVGVVLFATLPAYGWLRGLYAALALGGAGAAAWWWGLRPASRFSDARDAARYLEERLPGARNDVSASIAFGRDLRGIATDGRTSLPLVLGVLSETRRTLEARRPEIAQAAPRPPLGPFVGATAACAASVLALSLAAPTFFAEGWRSLLHGAPEAAASAPDATQRMPLVADVTLTLAFPSYTGLGTRTQLNSTGSVEVLRGTEITFEAVSLQPVDRAELVLQITPLPTPGSEEAPTPREQRVVLERRPGERLVARFVAEGSGTYTVAARLPGGVEAADGLLRDLIVHPDEAPRVAIHEPEGEVDVAPEDRVTLDYEASDDFGMTELAVVTWFEGDPASRRRTVIKALDGAQAPALPGDARPAELGDGAGQPARGDSGRWELDLLPLKLQPRDRLVVTLEAVDNDGVLGAKIGTSEPVVLRVASAEDKHMEIVQEEEKLVEALLDVLGDYLEFPVGDRWRDSEGKRQEGVPEAWTADERGERYAAARPAHAKAGEVVASMGALLERMEQDPLMLRRDFELFKQTYDELYDRSRDEAELLARLDLPHRNGGLTHSHMLGLLGQRRLTIRTTEQGILRLEDLIASQRMENLLDTAKSLKDARERLRELLQKYKDTQDPALKAEIMREIQRIKERMQELMAKMQAQIQNLPREHVNMEALQREGMMKDVGDLNQNLDQIQQMLESGDMDGALQALDKMGENIDAMLNQMEKDFDGMQPDGLSEFDKKVAEVMDDLNNLQSQEEAVAEQTEAIAKAQEEERQRRMEKLMEGFIEDELKKVAELERRLDAIPGERLYGNDQEEIDGLRRDAATLRKALESKDIAQALEQAEELQERLNQASANMRLRASHMPRNNERAAGYAQADENVRRAAPQAREVADDLRDLMEQAQPSPSAEQQRRMEQLGQQQGEVRERAQQLQQKLGEMGQEVPGLGEKLGPGLQGAQQYMEGAQERLGQGEGRKAHDNEKMALDQLGQLRQQLRQMLQQQRMQQQREGGQGSLNREDVAIPDADRSAPRAFREDLMDAMKEGGLESYQDELKQYYESLVR